MTLNYKTINYYTFRLRRLSKRNNIRVLGLNRMRKLGRESDYNNEIEIKQEMEMEMEIKNLKLYMENKSIMEENQKLRRKALLLHKENKALLSQLQHMFSKQNRNIVMGNVCHDF